MHSTYCHYFGKPIILEPMRSRNDIELWLKITDPKKAREYIAQFDWGCPEHWRPTQVFLNSGREIVFKNMSDEDAVIAATTLLRDVQIPVEMREKQLMEEH